MKILLIGSDGQLGTEFRKLLEESGKEYYEVNQEELDMSNLDEVRRFFSEVEDFTHIINCAAYNDVDRAEEEKEKAFNINSYAPSIIAGYSERIGAVFMTFSSDFVFDGKKGMPYKEDDIPFPLSAYGKSKHLMEEEVMEKNGSSFVIRTSWLFGEGGKNFNRQVIDWSRIREELRIVDDQVSAPTYAKDLAATSWKLIQTGKFGLYHITNNGEASKYQQAGYILGKIGWKGTLSKAKTEDFNLAAQRPAYSKLSSEKVEKLLGKKMSSWQDAIDRFLEEMAGNKGL